MSQVSVLLKNIWQSLKRKHTVCGKTRNQSTIRRTESRGSVEKLNCWLNFFYRHEIKTG